MRLKSIQALLSVAQVEDKGVSVPFIHGVGPDVISVVVHSTTTQPPNDETAAVVLECIKFMEILPAQSTPEQRIRLLSIIIPTFVGLLYENVKAAHLLSIHNYALTAITKIGPLYPDEFRRIMAAAPHIKTALETAIRNKAAREASSNPAARSSSVAPAVPTIQLKMDFSAFK